MSGGAVPSGWTEERVAALRQHWEDGLSCAESARRLGGGVTRNAIIGKRMRLGLRDSDRRLPPLGRPPKPRVERGAPKPRRDKRDPPPTIAIQRQLRADQLRVVHEVDPGFVEAPAPDSPGLKTLMEREAGECAWPVGAPHAERGQLYCCAPVSHGPYCSSHHVGRGQSTRQRDARDPMVRNLHHPRASRDPIPALAKWGRDW